MSIKSRFKAAVNGWAGKATSGARYARNQARQDQAVAKGETDCQVSFTSSMMDPRTLWDIYLRISWVRACVNSISRTATSRGWDVRPKKGLEDNKAALDNCQVVRDALSVPNSQDDDIDLLVNVFEDQDIFGRGYWEIVRGGEGGPDDDVVALYTLDPVGTKPVKNKNGRIEKFVQRTSTGKKIEFEPWQVIYFPLSTKGNEARGISPLQSIQTPIATDLRAQEYNLSFFKNDATPGGVVEMPNAPTDQIERNREELNSEHRGAKNAHKILLLEGQAKFTKSQQTPEESGFLEQRRFTREEVLSVYGVPPSKIGIIETGNIGSGSGGEQDKTFKRDTVEPKQSRVAKRINRHFVRDALKILDCEFYWLPIDTQSEKEQAEVDEFKAKTVKLKAETVQILINTEVTSIEEARIMLGLPEKMQGKVKIRNTGAAAKARPEVDRKGESMDKDPKLREAQTVTAVMKEVGLSDDWLDENENFQKTFKGIFNELERWRKSILREVNNIFREKSHKRLGTSIVKAPADDLTALIDKGQLGEIMSTDIKESYSAGSKAATEEVSGAAFGPYEGDFEDIDSRVKLLTDKVADNLKEKVRAAVAEGVQVGEGAKEIADRINKIWGDDSVTYEYVRNGKNFTRSLSAEEWSLRVARTETISALNDGRWSSLSQNGVETVDVLAATGAEQQCLSLASSGPYTLTDGKGLLPVHPNCRCVLIPAKSGEEPSGKRPSEVLAEAEENA